ncbi:MAG: DNA topoisomerase 4 subunit A [Clostridia bacterium]|nr:DNA topoisomerase 4 subunit A [Clostridia bacterium]
MAKKDDNGFQEGFAAGNVIQDTVENVLPNSMLPYAEFVILDRALPRVEDGLKPVQRRILYTMYEMGLTPDKPHRKSARIVGDCMGKYHPHGDSSVYDAMVRMAQDFNMRMTLVDGHGNFGSVDGDPPAAMRYTEARLQPLAMELLRDIEKETVPFSLNYDDSDIEPDILPGRFPNLLVNGANGIAVGLATNIPTHNLGEVIDGCCAYIDNPKISLADMMKVIPGPDFPTGGYIVEGELKQAYETGKGRITLRAKYSVENGDRGMKLIVITELPYQTNKADLLRKIMLLREEKKDALSGIYDVVDESDRQGMRAVVYCRKDANVDGILAYLFKYTDLECTFGINMVAIADGKPQQLGLIDVIRYYTSYQRHVVLRRCRFELKEAQARCHILEGLIIGVHNIDEVIKIIKNADNTTDARKKLMDRFSLSEKQAQAILDLRLARLAKLEIKKLEEELAALKERIAELKKIIDSKPMQYSIVKQELRDIKRRYKSERRSVIVKNVSDINVVRSDVRRAATDWAVCLTATGTVKFIDKAEFKTKVKRTLPVSAKPESVIVESSFVTNEGIALLFTNLGNVVKVFLEQQEAQDYKYLGRKLSELCPEAADGERPVKVFTYSGELPKGDILFFTKSGQVKRSSWSEYSVLKSYYPAIKLKPGDEVLNVETFDEDDYSTMVFVTKQGMALNAVKDDVPQQGRISTGVRGILLGVGDEVVMATQHIGEGEIIIYTSLGLFKKVISSTLDQMSRARKGVMIAELRTKTSTGKVVFADYVTMPYALAVFNTDRTCVEVSTDDIPIEIRTSRGKPLGNPDITGVEAIYPVKPRVEHGDGRRDSAQIGFF